MQNNGKIENNAKDNMNYGILHLFASFLIIIAALAWDIINLPAQNSESYANLKILTGITLVSRVGIPIFVMLRGAYLLDPENDISDSDIFKRHIPRLVFVFLSWSLFYALLEQKFFAGLMAHGPFGFWNLLDLDRLLESTVLGQPHFWYWYTLLGLYLVTPLLRVFIKNASKAQINYFTFLCVAVTVIVVLNDGDFQNYTLNRIISMSNIFLPLGFLGYYLLGYTIKKAVKGKAIAVTLLLVSIVVFYYSLIWTMEWNSIGTRAPVNLSLLNYLSPVIYIFGITIFVIAGEMRIIQLKDYKNEILSDLSKYTVTLYMIYPLVIQFCITANVISAAQKWQTLLLNSLIVFIVALILAIVIALPYRGIKKWLGNS